MTGISSLIKACWIASFWAVGIAAWKACALIPSACRLVARVSVDFLLRQYMIPLCPLWFSINPTILLNFSRPLMPLITLNEMLGRSKDCIKVFASGMLSWIFMSSRVRRSAVAVNAITGTPGNLFLTSDNWLYSGRKSCHQWEIQCASSIAIRFIFRSRAHWSISASSLSGEMYNSFICPR